MPLTFVRAQIAAWGAFFVLTLAAALLWWPLPMAAADRGILAVLGLALSSLWRPVLRRTVLRQPVAAGRASAVLGLVVGAVVVGALWHALHQTLVAATFDAWSVVGLWRHGMPKMAATAPMPVGVMLAWGAAYVAVRTMRLPVSSPAANPLPDVRPLPDAPVYPDRVVVRETARTIPVPVASLRWVEAVGDYVRLHTADGRGVLHRQTMQAMEQALDPADWVRIHRSAIVRTNAVREIRRLSRGDAEAVLDDGTVRRIGRAYRDALDARLRR